MRPLRFDDINATYGDDLTLVFTVRDENDNPVTVTSATATFRIAAKKTGNAVLELSETDGITLSGSTATVQIDTADLPQYGDYWGQLRITKDGKSVVSAQGEIKLCQLIT